MPWNFAGQRIPTPQFVYYISVSTPDCFFPEVKSRSHPLEVEQLYLSVQLQGALEETIFWAGENQKLSQRHG
ncbi:hypothetical protein SDJN03_01722, partial [Cucurbita argyrosperma subsp. sororia]